MLDPQILSLEIALQEVDRQISECEYTLSTLISKQKHLKKKLQDLKV